MKYKIIDKKYHFISAFDTDTGAYVRTGVIDENGKDTGTDPFMASLLSCNAHLHNESLCHMTDWICSSFSSHSFAHTDSENKFFHKCRIPYLPFF